MLKLLWPFRISADSFSPPAQRQSTETSSTKSGVEIPYCHRSVRCGVVAISRNECDESAGRLRVIRADGRITSPLVDLVSLISQIVSHYHQLIAITPSPSNDDARPRISNRLLPTPRREYSV